MRAAGLALAQAAQAPRALAMAALALAIAALAACTGKPPEIGQVDLKPIYVRDPASGSIEARLRLYLQASDPDGNEDLSAVYLINDAKELFWEIPSGSWQNTGSGWIGTYSLALPTGWRVPAGSYRVVLQDASGQTIERQVSLDAAAVGELRFPRARDQGGRVAVDPPNAWILAYSAGGELVTAAPPAGVAWDRVSSYYVYVSDPARRVGLLSGPYRR
jgi:hypothetical protein